LQPDTIIPNPANPQSFNRFSYVGNRPINYNDPSGHNAECGLGELGCNAGTYTPPPDQRGSLDRVLASFGITTNGDFSRQEKWAILRGARLVGDKFAKERNNGETAADAFVAVYESINITKETSPGICDDPTKIVKSGGCTYNAHDISFWSMSGHGDNGGVGDINRMMKNVVHEFGHAFNNARGRPASNMSSSYTRSILRPNISSPLGQRWEWQQSADTGGSEIFADMFIAWTYDEWNPDPSAEDAIAISNAQDWMDGLVP